MDPRHTKFFDLEDYKKYAYQMVDLTCDLYKRQDQFPVQPDIKPGDVRKQFPQHPPEKGEPLEDIIKDTEQIIFPNMTQWQHPKQFGYFPATTSHPAVIADIFNNVFFVPALSWYCCPAATDLETLVMDWAAEFLHLPESFKFTSTGGGQVSTTTTDSLMLSIHAAKKLKMQELGFDNTDPRITKFVGYINDMSYHFEKPLRFKDIPYVRKIKYQYDPEKNDFFVDPEDYRRAIEQDKQDGLIPFWVGLSLGTTSTCSVDPIKEITKISKEHGLYVCVDAAYLGSAQVCEEYRYLADAVQDVDFYVVNFVKWMLSGFNGAMFWVRNRHDYISTFIAEYPEYLKSLNVDEYEIINYKDWITGQDRKFNALRIWYVIRHFGVEGLKENIRNVVKQAKYFESLVLNDNRFRIISTVKSGLVCFRYYDDQLEQKELNVINKNIYLKIEEDTTIGHIVSSEVCGIYFLRFVINCHNTIKADIDEFWNHTVKSLEAVLENHQKNKKQIA